MINKIKRLLEVGLAFGLSKSAVFFVPLLLSNILPAADYGLFESCLAYGSLLAVVLGCGLVAAIPYFMMVRNTTDFNGLIYLHAALIFLPLVLLIPLFAFGLVTASVFLIAIFAAVINWQRVFATDMKTRGKPTYSSFAESFVYMAILVVSLAALENLSIHRMSVYLMAIFLPLAVVLTIVMLRRYPITRAQWRLIPEMYAYALPTILPGMSLLLITSLVRLIAPPIMGAEKLAIYSFYFRFASIAVVVYQFLATIFFAEMYKREPNELDKIFTRVALLILALAAAGFVVFPQVFSGFFKLFSTFAQYWPLYAILVFFCFFWVCEAMLESIIFRCKLATKFLGLQMIALLAFTIAASLVLLLNASWLTITMLAFLHTLLMAMVVMMQLRLLSKNGVPLPWLTRFNGISIAGLVVGYSLVSVLS